MQLIEYLIQVASIIQPIIKEDAARLLDACFTLKWLSQDTTILVHMVMDSSFLYFIYEDAQGGLYVSNTLCTINHHPSTHHLITKECIIWEPEFHTDVMGHEMTQDVYEFEVEWSVFTGTYYRTIKSYNISQAPLLDP
jgi:hypothetical protein